MNKINHTLSAAILAGGKACRLGGMAKGELVCSNHFSIIQTLICALREAGIESIVIVSNQEAYSHYPVEIISDLRSGIGPLAGIESAMSYFQGKSDATLFLSCDMPNIMGEHIVQLRDGFLRSDAGVVFAKTNNYCHHLFSIANNSLLRDVSKKTDEGERQVGEVWQALKAKPVFFEAEQSFLNINTFEDLKDWRNNDGK